MEYRQHTTSDTAKSAVNRHRKYAKSYQNCKQDPRIQANIFERVQQIECDVRNEAMQGKIRTFSCD